VKEYGDGIVMEYLSKTKFKKSLVYQAQKKSKPMELINLLRDVIDIQKKLQQNGNGM